MSHIPAADMWEAARQSERGLRLRFETKERAFLAQMRLYSFRAKERKRLNGVSLYDQFSIQIREEPQDNPGRPWALYIYPAGQLIPIPIDATVEKL